ncbi:MAG TPA: methyltransferase domain-containing protein [Acidimicrobiia bacterium]|nr:methyltransferase domain-containing protein [Acidimicrobiia bacterium]
MDATDWDERYRSSDQLWSVTPNLFVADRLADVTPGRGLDLASGEGRNAIWLAERGWAMTAVDFSEVASSRGGAQSDLVEFVVADVRDWEPDGRFDLVLIAYLHLMPPDFEKVIRTSREWLAPGGELFLIGHDVANVEHGHGGPQVPEILWSVPDLLAWLDGMTVIEAQVVRRPVETEEGRVFARDALVRVRALS